MLGSGLAKRKQLLLLPGGLYAWMRHHDALWMDSMFPNQRKGPRQRSSSSNKPAWWLRHQVSRSVEGGRAAVLKLGLHDRTQLRREHLGLYLWMKRHDEQWLYSTCHTRSPIGRPEKKR